MIRTQAGTYEVIEENRDGWNPEAFKDRYSDILDKYDYIVGDWGYGQLRLRGFYSDNNRKVPFEQRISALDEYLHEFCNFGCPYFVLQKVKAAPGAEDRTQYDSAEEEAEARPFGGREEPSQERKERRRFYPRHHKQERTERFNGASGDYRGSGRGERADKSRMAKERPEKHGREGGEAKDKKHSQARSNRDRDKVSSSPNQPKRDL